MRVVLDTNVVASALLWDGIPERLIEAAGEGKLELFTSEALLAELAGILDRNKFSAKLKHKGLAAADLISYYRMIADVVAATPVVEPRLRDPDDLAVLACALAARAEAIVTGDADLHALGSYKGIPVLSPALALQRISLG